VPTWLEIVLTLNFVATIVLVFLLTRIKGKDDNADVAALQLKIDQLSAKHDQFAVASAQSTSSLRTELVSTLSTEFSNLRLEVLNAITQIGGQTRTTLDELRTSTNSRLDKLTGDLTTQQTSLRESLNERLTNFQNEVTTKFAEFQRTQIEQGNALREAIDGTLSRLSRDIRDTVNELKADVNARIQEMAKQTGALKESAEAQQTTLRLSIEQKLDKLNESNSKKLDEMRETVDEKLHKTLESRLTESFGIVTEHLGKVQLGLGEMKELATGVGDLKRLLTNVRTRGTLGEAFAVGMLLEQMLAPNQYIRNANIKPGSRESVEFAIRLPSGDGQEALLPIDSKFPREDWDRLEQALEKDDKEAAKSYRRALLARVRAEAKKICDLYVSPPVTTDFAILCLATEGLYAEVNRDPGFVEELRSQFRVLVAGPTNLMAILTSLQMGFRTLAIQQKGSEVWNLLAATKNEFGKFGGLMDKVEKQVGTVQKTIGEVGKRTRIINKALRSVEILEMGAPKPAALFDLLAEEEDEPEGGEEVSESL
jgi:DNA recombination protein RmuC